MNLHDAQSEEQTFSEQKYLSKSTQGMEPVSISTTIGYHSASNSPHAELRSYTRTYKFGCNLT